MLSVENNAQIKSACRKVSGFCYMRYIFNTLALIFDIYSQSSVFCIYNQSGVRLEIGFQNLFCKESFDLALEISLKRTGAVYGIVTAFDNNVFGCIGNFEVKSAFFDTMSERFYKQVDNAGNISLSQRFIVYDLTERKLFLSLRR